MTSFFGALTFRAPNDLANNHGTLTVSGQVPEPAGITVALIALTSAALVRRRRLT